MDYHTFLENFSDIYLSKGAGQSKKVALTFDDGPGLLSSNLIDTLAKHNVKATFFCMLDNAIKHKSIMQKIINAKHEVASHSERHHNPAEQSVEEFIDAAITIPKKVFLDEFSTAVSLYRPPYGSICPDQVLALRKKGCKLIGWSIDPSDWNVSNEATHVKSVIDHVLQNIHPEAVIILHDGPDPDTGLERSKIIEITDGLIVSLKDLGYEFCLVSDLFSSRHTTEVSI